MCVNRISFSSSVSARGWGEKGGERAGGGANPGSLVTRFYGVYGVKQVHGRTVRRWVGTRGRTGRTGRG